MKQLTENEFDELYTPVKNHLDDNASFDGCLFETYGEEIDYVLEMAKENRVVTIIEGEDIEDDECSREEDGTIIPRSSIIYVSGYHLVNRLGFLVLDKAYKEDFEVVLDW